MIYVSKKVIVDFTFDVTSYHIDQLCDALGVFLAYTVGCWLVLVVGCWLLAVGVGFGVGVGC